MGKSQGRHRAVRSKKRVPIAGAAGVAAAGAAVLGLTPTLSASPVLAATVHYLPGTKIGDQRTPAEYVQFANAMIVGSGEMVPATTDYIDYPGSFWPITEPYFRSPTWNDSVATGLANLESTDGGHTPPAPGDTVFGFSQGAVVASQYKFNHRNDEGAEDITYVLVENPNRPNGGLLERFNGLYIPILDVSFSGATQPTTAHTIDIARQYDGWADFPTYPLNLLATANAVLGIVYVHGDTQDLNNQAAIDELENLKNSTAPDADMYYQDDTATNTEYYLIPTERLPLLMPFEGIVPDQVLDAADPPLRYLVELGYDRTDYGKPTPAGILPALNPLDVATGFADAVAEGIATGTGAATTSTTLANSQEQKGISAPADAKKPSAPTFDVPKLELPKFEAPKLPDALKPPTRAPRVLPKPDDDASAPADRTVAPRAVQKALKALAPKKDAAEPGAGRKSFSFNKDVSKHAADKTEPAKD